MATSRIDIKTTSFHFETAVPGKSKDKFTPTDNTLSVAYTIYRVLGTKPDVEMAFPSANIVVPNLLVFTIITTLTVLLVTWKLPKSCNESWENCILDATVASPLLLFYGNIFHKKFSKCKHFDFLQSILPWSKATTTEIVLMTAIVLNAVFRLYINFPKSFTIASVAYTISFLLCTVIVASILIQFGSIVHELNRKFSQLIEKSHRLHMHLLSEQWDIFDAIESINKAYGWSLMILSIWLSGTLVSDMYSAVHAILDKNVLLCIFPCASAAVKFAVFFFAMHECEKTKLLAEAFNNELFKLMLSNKELSRDSKLFLYVTMRQTVKFTACGFFNLGYPLLTSIIAAATTYLVILLQFSM